jgi:hypothetical protein
MGRPKKGAIRKPLAKKDTNVPPEVIILDEEEEKAKADHEERMRIVKLVCEACDREGTYLDPSSFDSVPIEFFCCQWRC